MNSDEHINPQVRHTFFGIQSQHTWLKLWLFAEDANDVEALDGWIRPRQHAQIQR
jgi:hypothetical protein